MLKTNLCLGKSGNPIPSKPTSPPKPIKPSPEPIPKQSPPKPKHPQKGN